MCVIYQIMALQVQEFASENLRKFSQFQFQLDLPYSNPKYNKILVYEGIGAQHEGIQEKSECSSSAGSSLG